MPRPVNRAETIDLHAPWWSKTKTHDGSPSGRVLADDEEGGRFVERWVVRKFMSERDEQQVADQLQSRIRTATGGKSSKQLGDALMQEIMRNQMAFARLYLLLQMTEEVTDETGAPQHLNRELISSLDKRDTQWVNQELDKLYGEPDVPVLSDDEEYAEKMREAAEQGAPVDEAVLTAEGRAAQRFRGAGKVTQLRG